MNTTEKLNQYCYYSISIVLPQYHDSTTILCTLLLQYL
jgi:hypothetical protein